MLRSRISLHCMHYNRCDECVTSRREDSLRHSRSRINAYRALASPSLIALSSKDPILTAFELSWELRRLSFLEHEFKCEYQVRREFIFIFGCYIVLYSEYYRIRGVRFNNRRKRRVEHWGGKKGIIIPLAEASPL